MWGFCRKTAKERGITGAVLKDGKVTPLDKDGNEMPQYAFDTKGEHPALVHLILLSDRTPLKEINEKVGVNFYASLPLIVLRRVRSLKKNQDIASYLMLLGIGLFVRNSAAIKNTRYLRALNDFVLKDFPNERKNRIHVLTDNADAERDQKHFPAVMEDILTALDQPIHEEIIAPNETDLRTTDEGGRMFLTVFGKSKGA